MKLHGSFRLEVTVEREFDLAEMTEHWTDQEREELLDKNRDDDGTAYEEAVNALKDDALSHMIGVKNDDVNIESYFVNIEQVIE